jgi:hypothetical protein
MTTFVSRFSRLLHQYQILSKVFEKFQAPNKASEQIKRDRTIPKQIEM